MVTVSVVENNTWGNTDTLVPGTEDEWQWGDGDEFLTFGHALGKAHAFGGKNIFPEASVSAMQAAGFEKITIDYLGLKNAGLDFPSIFIKCQAEWFMYAGDGFSDQYCVNGNEPGAVDMGDKNYLDCTMPRCYASDITNNGSWSDVDVIIFAACSVFNGEKDYGKDWYSIDGPTMYLGYRDDGPKKQGISIIKKWKELVDQGDNKALAWMQANAESLAWNASAYDKSLKFFWFYLDIPRFHELFVKDLDVESDFQIATVNGFYEAENIVLTVFSSSQINLSWTCGINDPGVQWEYYVLRSRTNSLDDVKFYAKTNNTFYNDTGLEGGTTYFYWIGIHAGNYEPTFSAPVNAVTTGSSGGGGSNPPPDAESPQAPSNLHMVE